MPTRTKANKSGDVGELSVILDMVQLGAAVNSLAQSDYGWDAHVHTPEDALTVGNLPDSWKMSGLSAHIQVKNADSGKGARVKIGSLRAWLAGSKVGTPTFYFFVKRESPRYASPKMLNAVLDHFKDDSDDREISIGHRRTRPADYQVFSHLLRLWTRYPRVLLNAHVFVDDWHLLKRNHLVDKEKGFVAHVYLAWLRAHFPQTPIPERGLYSLPGWEIIWAAADELSGLDGGGTGEEQTEAGIHRTALQKWVTDSLVEAAHHMPEDASEERKKAGPMWPEPSLGTSYALATSPEAASAEARDLVRDVMAYYRFCVDRAARTAKR